MLGFRRSSQLLLPSLASGKHLLDNMLRTSKGLHEGTYDVGQSTNIKWQEGMVSREAKEQLLRQRGCILWFTGLSGSGKSTVACTVEHALSKMGRATAQLDGDNIRHGLNANLGFSPTDREENIRRIGEVAKLFAEAGIMTLVSFISPYRKDRDRVRSLCNEGDFIEVYMDVSLEVCEQRDPKGLYKLARAGKIKCFTGIDDPYEEPLHPEIRVTSHDARQSAAQIINYLQKQGYLEPPATRAVAAEEEPGAATAAAS